MSDISPRERRKKHRKTRRAENKSRAYDERARRRGRKSKRAIRKARKRKRRIIAAIILLLFAGMYLTFLYSDNAFISKWRTIYIETAMSTTHHKWLATMFIPHSIIDDVMKNVEEQKEAQKELESKWEVVGNDNTDNTDSTENTDPIETFLKKYWEIDSTSVRDYLTNNSIDTQEEIDSLVISDLSGSNGLKTAAGDKLLVVDVKNGLLIIQVSGSDYVGKLAIEKDPSKVCLDKSKYLGSRGEIIDDYGERNNAILAINASGFRDVGGHGSGGEVKGSMVIDGTEYGSPNRSDYKFFGMTYDNKFNILNWGSVDKTQYRWGIQFFPAIVVDGECTVAGTYGLGIQPRTAIGQAKDGSFLMLIVDGRQVGYSLGTTMEECANQLIKYGAYQAANLDGGSSSIMWYNGQQITKSSSPSGFGRYLPDAIYVKKAS